jgi:hypothetical protein
MNKFRDTHTTALLLPEIFLRCMSIGTAIRHPADRFYQNLFCMVHPFSIVYITAYRSELYFSIRRNPGFKTRKIAQRGKLIISIRAHLQGSKAKSMGSCLGRSLKMIAFDKEPE